MINKLRMYAQRNENNLGLSLHHLLLVTKSAILIIQANFLVTPEGICGRLHKIIFRQNIFFFAEIMLCTLPFFCVVCNGPNFVLPVTNFINIFYLIFSLVYIYIFWLNVSVNIALGIRSLFVYFHINGFVFLLFSCFVTFEHRYILHRCFH